MASPPPPRPATSRVQHTSLLTGATGALGIAVARGLALHGGHLVLAVRDEARGVALRDTLIAETGNPRITVEVADLAIRDDVKMLAHRFMQNNPRIDALVHAAGTFEPERVETEGGLERTWATNVLGFYQLTSRLTEMLRYCRPSRVVVPTSRHVGGLSVADPQYRQRSYRPWQAYTASQQAARILVRAFADQLDADVVAVNAVDPGPVAGGLVTRTTGMASMPARTWVQVAGVEPLEAAAHVVRAALHPDLTGVSGRLLHKGADAGPASTDDELVQPMMALCSSTTRVHPEWDSNIWREDDSVILDLGGGAQG